uniref:Uncharacterized protein n=1 Tax=Solanum tuberosum TaxID=4113 RepID=M1AK34_SOLTU
MAHKYVYVTTEENDCNSMRFYLQSVSVLIQYPLSLVKHHNLYQLEILLRHGSQRKLFIDCTTCSRVQSCKSFRKYSNFIL